MSFTSPLFPLLEEGNMKPCERQTFDIYYVFGVLRGSHRDVPRTPSITCALALHVWLGIQFFLFFRSYRAPEVILGLPYGAKVDVVSPAHQSLPVST